jgi:hypothetical protein
MSIQLIKEGNLIRVVESSEPIPEGTVLRLFTEDELQRLQSERTDLLNVQMPAFIRGDEEEDVADLFEVPAR